LFEFNGKPCFTSWFGGVRPSFSPVVLDLSNTFFSFVFTLILFVLHDSLRFSDSCLHPPRGFRLAGSFWLIECVVGQSFGLSPKRLSLTLAAVVFVLVFELFNLSPGSARACGLVSVLVLCEHASQPGPVFAFDFYAPPRCFSCLPLFVRSSRASLALGFGSCSLTELPPHVIAERRWICLSASSHGPDCLRSTGPSGREKSSPGWGPF
jgi:hypothetical protein